MITEEKQGDGAIYLRDGQGQMTFVFEGSALERIWKNWDSHLERVKFQNASASEKLAVFIVLRDATMYFYRDREWKSDGVTPGLRRERMNKLEDSLLRVLSGLRDLDVKAKEFLEDDLSYEFEEEDVLEDLSNKLEFLRVNVSGWARDKSEIKVGKSTDTGLQDLVLSLAHIYEQCSGEVPKKPHLSSVDKFEPDELPYDGPFYRFCVPLFEEIAPTETTKLSHAITAALKAGC